MSWYYATKDKRQVGPVDESALEELLRSGAIARDTLIWKEGMSNWASYSSVFSAPAFSAPVPAGMARCAECGQPFPPEQLINLAGRSICGACKPVAVQKFQEGVVSYGREVSADELLRTLDERGYDFTIGSVLSRAWSTVKENYWPCLGVALLSYLILGVSGNIPLLGLFTIFLVQPQIIAGLFWYFLKQFRKQPATLNDSFEGFRRGYWQQALYMLMVFVIIIVCVIPLGIVMAVLIPNMKGNETVAGVGIFAAIGIFVLILWYITLCWLFTPLLILDKGLKALDAMKVSRRAVHLHFWKILGLVFVLGLLGLAGLLVLLVGAVFLLPVLFAAIVRLYEDIFGEKENAAA